MREYDAFRVNTIEECIEAIRNGYRYIEYPKEIEEQLFNYIEKLRDEDDSFMFRCASFLYSKGDYKGALKLCKPLVDKHHIEATYLYSLFFFKGRGVPKSLSKALVYLQKAAEKGYSPAQCRLGSCYAEGKGVERSFQKAIYWFNKSAEQNNISALVRLGSCYYKGRGVVPSNEEAFKCYKRIVDVYGRNFKNKEFTPYCKYMLGYFYYTGLGGIQSNEEAYYWFNQAAEEDYPQAIYYLALFSYQGVIVNQSYEKAIELLDKISDGKKNQDVYYLLAHLYEEKKTGERIKSLKRAGDYYKKALRKGKTEASLDIKRVSETMRVEEHALLEVPEDIDIFISWNHNNQDFKNQMVASIKAKGYKVWDSDIDGKGDLDLNIKYAIEHAKGFIVILSEEAFTSKYMNSEVKLMYERVNAKNEERKISENDIRVFIYGDADKILKELNNVDDRHGFKKLQHLTSTFSTNVEDVINAVGDIVRKRIVLDYQRLLRESFSVFPISISDVITKQNEYHEIKASLEFEKGYINRDLMDEEKSYSPTKVLKIDDSDIILIHGEGGSGKSLYVKNLIKNYSNEESLFFYLPCADIQKEMEKSDDHDIMSLICKISFNLASFYGISLSRINDIFKNDTRRFFVIFDALDEGDKYKSEIIKMFNNVLSLGKRVKIIVTTRNKSDASLIENITNRKVHSLLIKALNDEEIIKLFDSIYKRNYEDVDNKEVDNSEKPNREYFTNYLSTLAEDIKKNPLLISNLIYIYFANKELQTQKSYILETSSEILVDGLEKERDVYNQGKETLNKLNIELKELLPYIAFMFATNNELTLEDVIKSFKDNEISSNDVNEIAAYLRSRRIIVGHSFTHDIYSSFFASKYMFNCLYKLVTNKKTGLEYYEFYDDGKETFTYYQDTFFPDEESPWPNVTVDFIGKLDYEIRYHSKNKLVLSESNPSYQVFDYSLQNVVKSMSNISYQVLTKLVNEEKVFYWNDFIKEHLNR